MIYALMCMTGFVFVQTGDGRIIVGPKDAEAVVGTHLVLRCQTDIKDSANPVEWHFKANDYETYDIIYKSGLILNENRGKMKVEANVSSGHYDLVIFNISLNNAGAYTCIDDDSHQRAEIIVFGREEEKFCSNDVAAAVGDVVNLTFPTSKKDSIKLRRRSVDRSYPVHVFRDGRLVNNYYVLSGRFSFSASKNSWHLVIKNIQTSDAGRYICSEDNGLGKHYTRELVVVDANGVECSTDAEECNEEMNITCSANYSGHCRPHLQLTLDGNNLPLDETPPAIANTVSLKTVVHWTNVPLCRIAAQHYFINSTCRTPDQSICKETNMLVTSNTIRIVVGAVVGIATLLIIIVIARIVVFRQGINITCSNGCGESNNTADSRPNCRYTCSLTASPKTECCA